MRKASKYIVVGTYLHFLPSFDLFNIYTEEVLREKYVRPYLEKRINISANKQTFTRFRFFTVHTILINNGCVHQFS